jgi:hypothetical protein
VRAQQQRAVHTISYPCRLLACNYGRREPPELHHVIPQLILAQS